MEKNGITITVFKGNGIKRITYYKEVYNGTVQLDERIVSLDYDPELACQQNEIVRRKLTDSVKKIMTGVHEIDNIYIQ